MDSKRFYHSAAWLKLRLSKLRQDPLCQVCIKERIYVAATIVHHVVEITVDPDLRLDLDNLQSLCAGCHSRMHAHKHIDI
jgi:5-methylcytosine-specific restriction enzyme A